MTAENSRPQRACGTTVADLLLTTYREPCILLLTTNRSMTKNKTDVLHGSLALMVLRILDTLGPLHGWGIARRIEQMTDNVLELNQGSLYPALLRLEQMGWVSTKWGESENNRRAKFYSITRAGRKQLASEAANWERMAAILARFVNPGEPL